MLDNTYLTTNGFICTAYTANSATANGDVNIIIENNHVTWNGSRWNFDGGTRNWPATGDLDFFAYMPSPIPAYITSTTDVASSITYAARNPQFKCASLPVTNSGQDGITEFVYALTTGQNKTNAANGVTLSFLHPFSRIQLQLAANHPAIHINTITFKSIKNNGSYSSGTWDTSSGATTDFVWTFNADYSNSGSVQALGGSYIVIPQTWEGVIEVNATWNVWGEPKTQTVSTDLTGTITWTAGNSYTYTFTITETDLVVNTSKYTEQW